MAFGAHGGAVLLFRFGNTTATYYQLNAIESHDWIDQIAYWYYNGRLIVIMRGNVSHRLSFWDVMERKMLSFKEYQSDFIW